MVISCRPNWRTPPSFIALEFRNRLEDCNAYMYIKQEALLLQTDCMRHLSVEILQLQNISL